MGIDILMKQTENGGDFVLQDNDLLLSNSIENQVPLYLFGGNIEQSTKEGDSQNLENNDWWGNHIGEVDNFNSEFERTLQNVILNSQGRAALINAAKTDLKPMSEFAEVIVDGSIPKTNQFLLEVIIKEPKKQTKKTLYLFENAVLINTDIINL